MSLTVATQALTQLFAIRGFMRRPIITILALLRASQACAAEVTGRVRVVDGDTLWVSGVKIRLNGIDAPERGQARFREATSELQR